MRREKHSRLFLFKVYKAMCKMLGADAISLEKLARKDKKEVIVVHIGGRRLPLLVADEAAKASKLPRKCTYLRIHGNVKKKVDLQKAVVLRILKALETTDVFVDLGWNEQPQIKQGTSFEAKVIEMDLDGMFTAKRKGEECENRGG